MINVKRKERIRTSIIKENTELKYAFLHITELKWKWAGHFRFNENRWAKTFTKCFPYAEEGETTSWRTAKDRQAWKDLWNQA